jgi:phenylacetate-CoA ligase
MSTQIILKVLALRRRLRQRDRWTRLQLEEHQDRALHRLREHAYVRSLFYRRSPKGFTDRPLGDLPILTKEMVMEHFDELVTDPTVRLTDVEAHLATLSGGDELFGALPGGLHLRQHGQTGSLPLGPWRVGPPCLHPTTARSTGLA